MDNSDFLPHIRAIAPPGFHYPPYFSPVPVLHKSRSVLIFSWFSEKFRLLYRYFRLTLHDLIFSSLLGYLTLNERLYVAVHENNVQKAQKLLSQGASPSFLPTHPNSFIQRLMKNKNEVKSRSRDPVLHASIEAMDSMLYMAVSNNSLSLVKELIDYNDYGRKGQHTEVVSLCLAVKRGYFNIVVYLIDYGHINPDDRVQSNCKHCKTYSNGKNGKSYSTEIQTYQFPLYHACRENHMTILKYLVECKNCDINQLTTTYETCVHGAIVGATENRFDSAINNERRYRIVEYLLKRSDCNPNLGLNPLCISLADDHIYDYPSLLLQYNCDVDRLGWSLNETAKANPGRNNYTIESLDHPLNICLDRLCQIKRTTTIADHSSQKQYALKLIQRNANIYAMYDCTANYPFSLAVQTGDEIFIQAILLCAETQIKLDIIEPLVYACEKLYDNIVKMLIDFGFNPNTIMTRRTSLAMKDVSANEITSSNILQYLDSYRLFPPNFRRRKNSLLVCESKKHVCCNTCNTGIQTTPLLALSDVSLWIFEPEQYDATVKTLQNLFSRIPVDFSIQLNQLAFYRALSHEHLPLVYFCLENFCPIILPDNTINFRDVDSKNHFCYTLFHIIAACCRLASNSKTKRILLDAYAKAVLRKYTAPYPLSEAVVLAYIKLWLKDKDFIYDETLFEHLIALPYVGNLLQSNDENKLRSSFGQHYNRMIEGVSRSRPVYTLKHICRLKIRAYGEMYCERKQTNMLKILPSLDCLPKVLQSYLFYTRMKSNSLINFLLNNESWNKIQWM